MALIWFSCFCCASENLRVMPAVLADSWIDLVFAVRQPLSAPTCEKPIVMASLPPEDPESAALLAPHAAKTVTRAALAATGRNLFNTGHASMFWTPSLAPSARLSGQ